MDIRYMQNEETYTTEEKLDQCLKHLKGNDKFDYSFLESMKKYVDAGYFSDAQRESIDKIYTRWNIEMHVLQNEKKLKESYGKMMNLLESCPTHKEEAIKMDVDEKDEIISKLEKKIQHLEQLLKIYMP